MPLIAMGYDGQIQKRRHMALVPKAPTSHAWPWQQEASFPTQPSGPLHHAILLGPALSREMPLLPPTRFVRLSLNTDALWVEDLPYPPAHPCPARLLACYSKYSMPLHRTHFLSRPL